MTKERVVKLEEIRSRCQTCSLFELCMPMGLAEGDLDKLDRIIKRRRPVEKGEYLYRIGDPFTSLYAVRSGSLKTYTSTRDGRDQIISLHLPGELMGLDAIGKDQHTCSAMALETTSVCELPYERLESLSLEIPGLQHHLLSLMSEEIRHDQCHMTVLARLPVDSRLASFLINLSERYRARGFSAVEFNLSMSRNDIANLLGMAVETVSRLFTQFQEQGLLEVERKHIKILDYDSLQAMHNHCGDLESDEEKQGDSSSSAS
ncbi:MAG TPA: fumarate/nitrate reduction transcriptional regulator Fnr [Gammaproteobacteria bacterium]|nr:fumarate/nitrate reduction transcriptional regulator Fnr [Gammaproteobacteria bacterium]